jgi:hypothetical protein
VKRALTLVLIALLLQIGAGLGFWWISNSAYRTPRTLSESLELPLTYAGLVLAGPLAVTCAAWAACRMLHLVRPWLALPAVLVLCLPAMFVGVLASFVLAGVRGWC